MKHSDARTPDEIAEEFEALHGRKLGGDYSPASCSQSAQKPRPKVHDFRKPTKRINTLEEAFKRAENH